MTIADMLAAEDALRLSCLDKGQLLRTLSRHAALRLGLAEDVIGKALTDREALGSTGIGGGVALPHARLGDVRHPFATFAALTKPIEFGAVDDRPVDLVFLMILPAHLPEDQLRCLACAARRFRDPDLPSRLRQAVEPSRLYDLMAGR